MKKILFSAAIVLLTGAVVVSGTGAFFSDSETSSGNTFTAGDLDLGLGNAAYYNGVANASVSWTLDFDISSNGGGDVPRVFRSFNDIKPGDYFTNSLEFRVVSNDSWLCQDVTLTRRDDVTCTEPEIADDPTCSEPNLNISDGDLTNLSVTRWVDDGDSVLETGETVFSATNAFGSAASGTTLRQPLVDPTLNVFDAVGTPFPGNTSQYVGFATCYGPIGLVPVLQDGVGNARTPAMDNNNNGTAGEAEDGGFSCDGSAINNRGQTDTLVFNTAYRAVQSRNNATFSCATP